MFRNRQWEIENGFNHDVHDNDKQDTVGGNLDSSQAAAQSQSGATAAGSTGNLTASDNAIVSNSGNETITTTETDPGVLSAFQTFSGDETSTTLAAEEEAGTATAAAAGLTAQALKQAGDLSAQETKTPIQQLEPFIVVGAILIVGLAYFLTKD